MCMYLHLVFIIRKIARQSDAAVLRVVQQQNKSPRIEDPFEIRALTASGFHESI